MTWDEEVARIKSALNEIPKAVVARVAMKIQTLVEKQFDDGTDPYGETWASRVDGSASHLDQTEDMRDSLSIASDDLAIIAKIDEPYTYHEYGTSNMPARPILPDDRGAPDSWPTALQEATDEEVKERLG